jgi:Rha family phage regulatory protein
MASLVASSLDVAAHFDKRHAHVLDAVRQLISDSPAHFTEPNFRLSDYTDETGRSLPMYTMTRDGFSLLAMGFTGKKALEWKLRRALTS